MAESCAARRSALGCGFKDWGREGKVGIWCLWEREGWRCFREVGKARFWLGKRLRKYGDLERSKDPPSFQLPASIIQFTLPVIVSRYPRRSAQC